MAARSPSIVVAAAVPFLFLDLRYQPDASVHAFGTSIGVSLSDVAVAVVVLFAAVVGARNGLAPLRRGTALWVAAGALVVWIFFSTLYARSRGVPYAFSDHLTTALKFFAYALLAPAVVVLVRTWRSLMLVTAAIVGWAVVATAFGVLQFFGAANEIRGKRPLQREPSLLSVHEFGMLAAAALALALAWLLLGRRFGRRELLAAAALTCALGVVVSAAINVLAGVFVVAVAFVLLVRRRQRIPARRLAALAALLAATTAGVLVLRGGQVYDYLSFLGLRATTEEHAVGVESWRQRTLLAYIGTRIWLDHPVLGVGWRGSLEYGNYAPYLHDAHRHFDQPPQAFPSPAHPWGPQNAYIEALADLGLVGLVLLLATFVAGLVLGVRAALRAPPAELPFALLGVAWVLIAMAVWNGYGFTAGIPLDALTWLGLGVAATTLDAQ